MDRQEIFVVIAVIGLISGLFSPLTSFLVVLSPAWLPEYLQLPGMTLFFSQIFSALLTILIGGIPAAVFERATGRPETDRPTMWVWLVGTTAASVPALLALPRFL